MKPILEKFRFRKIMLVIADAFIIAVSAMISTNVLALLQEVFGAAAASCHRPHI